MKLNILLLITNTPDYFETINTIGLRLHSLGHNVYFACESHLPEVLNNKFFREDHKFYFSRFNYLDLNLEDYLDLNLRRETYYSCFDRDVFYSFNNKSNKNMDKIILGLSLFFKEIIESKNINLILGESVANSFTYSANNISKILGINYFGLMVSRIPNRFEIITDGYGNIQQRQALFNQRFYGTSSENGFNIEEYIANVLAGHAKPSYMVSNDQSMQVNYFKHYLAKMPEIWLYIKYKLSYYNESKTAYLSNFPFKRNLKSVVRNVKRWIKTIILSHKFDKVENELFILLPLQFQPESSTSYLAQYYDNQYEFIKNVMFSLPLGVKLYVKDHPNGIGFLPFSFYKKIFNLPEVKYINPLANNTKLIKNSLGIVTLTSTLGYEALLLEKPVITLGDVFYNYHPYCFHLDSYHQISNALNQIMNYKFLDFKSINLKFVQSYLLDTRVGSIFSKKHTTVDVADKILDYFYELKDQTKL